MKAKLVKKSKNQDPKEFVGIIEKLLLGNKKNISLILAHFSLGGPNEAAKDGPNVLLKNNIVDELTELGFNIKVIQPPKKFLSQLSSLKSNKKSRIKNISAVVKMNEWIASTVKNEIKDRRLPITIGGDHSLAIGTITGTSDALGKIGVLWIDRHFDAHSPKNTPSWRAHGMPVAVLTAKKEYDPHPDFQRLLDIGEQRGLILSKGLPKVKPEHFVQIGIGEKSKVKPKTKWYPMEEIDDLGIKKVIDNAINYLSKRTNKIYVAWDIDSMNVTGTGTSGDEQLTLREGLIIARTINSKIRLKGKLVGFEMMELAPKLEKGHLKGQTINWAKKLLIACFGDSLFNNFSSMKRNIDMHASKGF